MTDYQLDITVKCVKLAYDEAVKKGAKTFVMPSSLLDGFNHSEHLKYVQESLPVRLISDDRLHITFEVLGNR